MQVTGGAAEHEPIYVIAQSAGDLRCLESNPAGESAAAKPSHPAGETAAAKRASPSEYADPMSRFP